MLPGRAASGVGAPSGSRLPLEQLTKGASIDLPVGSCRNDRVWRVDVVEVDDRAHKRHLIEGERSIAEPAGLAVPRATHTGLGHDDRLLELLDQCVAWP